jgi:hypothetical protein
MVLAGCTRHETVEVHLHTRPVVHEAFNTLEVQAQVTGPLEGLHYKWFADSGECQPQESDQPNTVFKFMEGVRQDRVSVEVWRKAERVAQSEVKVKYDDLHASSSEPHAAECSIEITTIPPSEPGGARTHADIGGRTTGAPPGCLIVLYARAYGYWYVQPGAGALLAVRPDNTWYSWTHTGTKYAALLVRPNYEPLERLEMLPQTNNIVLASAIVDGVINDKSTNATAGVNSAQ